VPRLLLPDEHDDREGDTIMAQQQILVRRPVRRPALLDLDTRTPKGRPLPY
jgi:hypothetical protein